MSTPINPSNQNTPSGTGHNPAASNPANSNPANSNPPGGSDQNPSHRVQHHTGNNPSVQHPPGSQPRPTPINTRNPTPTDKPPSKLPSTPEYNAAKEALISTLEKIWTKDQLTLIQQIIDNPKRTMELPCELLVQLPGTSQPVRVYPVDNSLGPGHRGRYMEYLKGACKNLHQMLENNEPLGDLFELYKHQRQKLLEAGGNMCQEKGQFFPWPEEPSPFYDEIITTAFNRTMQCKNDTFVFTRSEPDPTLVRQIPTPPPTKHKVNIKPKKTTALNNPNVAFRVQMSEQELQQHADRMRQLQQQTGTPPANPNPPPVPTPNSGGNQ